MDENSESIPGFGSVDNFFKTMVKDVVEATKASNGLPSSEADWEYYMSFEGFKNAASFNATKTLELITKLMNHQGIKGSLAKLDLEEQFDCLSDATDVIMDKVNAALDVARGVRKEAETVVLEINVKTPSISGSWNKQHAAGASGGTPDRVRLLAARNIQRPQLLFKEKIDNRPGPFVPKLTEKPNALKPLAILIEITERGEEYSHPYEFELEKFKPKPEMYEKKAPIEPKPMAETSLTWVDKPEKLESMLHSLKQVKEIAVDLEHHNYRSYQGITCLMQISTRHEDFLVDTLALWGQLTSLNEVFTHPSIVKVFHGADKDIEWLQRDLGLYIVNMFDTHQAAKLLQFPHLSLAYLLKHYCKVSVNKQYQLADWRMRPLPEDMSHYAREDTHYLLYVYDRLKSDLWDKGGGDHLLLSTWESSRLICLRRYMKPMITATSHLDLYVQSKKLFNNKQMYALVELFRWRDRIAREEDESSGYVLPKHMLLQICEVLPREMQGILACCNPVPPLLRQHLLHIHQILLKARDQPLTAIANEGKSLPLPASLPMTRPTETDEEHPLHSKHDLSHELKALPTLLQSVNLQTMDTSQTDSLVSRSRGLSSIFQNLASSENCRRNSKVVNLYDRYLAALASRPVNVPATTPRVKPKPVNDESRKSHLEQYYQSFATQLPPTQEKGTPSAENEDMEDEAVAAKNENVSEVNRKKKKKQFNAAKKVAQPLRQKVKKAKTEDKSQGETSQTAAAAPSSQDEVLPAMKKAKFDKKPVEIEAYDYKQVDFSVFAQKPTQDDNGGVKRGKRNRRSRGKGKGKSMTYANKKS